MSAAPAIDHGPILRTALRRRRAHRAAQAGLRGRLLAAAWWIAVVLALVPLVRQGFLHFLEGPEAARRAGLEAVTLRAALGLQLALGLGVHGRVLRGRLREVLGVHPVQGGAVVRAALGELALERLPWLAGIAVVLAPVALELGTLDWAASVTAVATASAFGLMAATVALLGAVRAAEDPAWAGVLDLVRGNNPRAQAAIVWALAPSTLVGGYLALMAASGAARVGAGDPTGWGLVLLPLAATAAIWPLLAWVRPDETWHRATVVLAEIRERYATVETEEEARAVYLDWTAARLPEGVRRWAIEALRAGWRTHRGWVSGQILIGLLAVGVAWTGDPSAIPWAAATAGAGGALAGATILRLALDEDPFLATWLGADPTRRALGRAWAGLGWAGGPALAAAGALALRQGLGSGAEVLGLALALDALAVLVAVAVAPWRGSGVAAYGGAVAVGAAVVAALASGGAA